MGNTFQTFNFQTKNIPQSPGTDGAHWESLPIASFPPSFDISIPDSTANAVALAMSNITNTFSGLNNTLQSLTQGMQTAACSLGSLVDSLLNAQLFADEFANNNNNATLYVRTVGLTPIGTINSQSSFINQVRSALLETGDDPGEIPKIVPAEIPLNANTIVDTLAGNTLLDQLGDTALGGSVGQALGQIGVSASFGAGLPDLSGPTVAALQNGYGIGNFSTSIISSIREGGTSTTVRIILAEKPPGNPNDLVGKLVSINGTSTNNGTFVITGFSDGSAVQQPNALINVLTGGIIPPIQNFVSEVQQALSPFVIKIENANGATEGPGGTATIPFGDQTVSAVEAINSAFVAADLVGPNATNTTIPVTDLIDLLVENEILGVNPDDLEQDISASLERLTRLLSPSSKRVGGFVLVGKAPDLGALAAKVQSLSDMMEWLKPLADQLTATALNSFTPSSSGIDFDPTNVDLSKLDSQANVGKKDAEAAKQAAEASGVLDHEMIPLQKIPDDQNPSPNNFNAWKKFKPVQFIPGLEAFGEVGEGIQAAETTTQSVTAGVVNGLVGNLASLIDDGKSGLEAGINKLDAQSSTIDGLVNEMNALNDSMVQGLNWLKNRVGSGPVSMDGHLVGPKLDLLSNADFADAVEAAVTDFSDPNRPTFGQPAANGVLESQNQLNAALQGVAPPTTPTRIWFGILVFIVGKDKQDLGEQMRTIANLLEMDCEPIDLPPKPKLSFSGLSMGC